MGEEKIRNVEVGFSGGQAIALHLSEQAYDGLRKALRSGDSWHELETADGQVTLDLGKVLFVKSDTDEHRVGFSSL